MRIPPPATAPTVNELHDLFKITVKNEINAKKNIGHPHFFTPTLCEVIIIQIHVEKDDENIFLSAPPKVCWSNQPAKVAVVSPSQFHVAQINIVNVDFAYDFWLDQIFGLINQGLKTGQLVVLFTFQSSLVMQNKQLICLHLSAVRMFGAELEFEPYTLTYIFVLFACSFKVVRS